MFSHPLPTRGEDAKGREREKRRSKRKERGQERDRRGGRRRGLFIVSFHVVEGPSPCQYLVKTKSDFNYQKYSWPKSLRTGPVDALS